MRERLRVVGGPRRGRRAKRLQRVERDNPRRDGRREILRQERTQRLVFPALDVARRPIVQQAHAEQMIFGMGDRNRLAHRIARTQERAEFQFVVEHSRRRIYGRIARSRRSGPAGDALACRSKRWTKRGRDTQSGSTYSSARAACRGETGCRRWWRDRMDAKKSV